MQKHDRLFYILTCFCLLHSLSLFAQKPCAPDTTILYATKDTCTLFLDIYDPTDGSEQSINGVSKPTVLFMFGGGFMGGNRAEPAYIKWFKMMNDYGYRVVSIDYRLGLKGHNGVTMEKFTVLLENAINLAVEDLYSATAYLVEHAEDLNINPDQIVLSGSSAGAITALQGEYGLCNHTKLSRILPEKFRYAGVMAFAGAIFSSDGILKITEKIAPVFLMHGTEDNLVPYKSMKLNGKGFYGSDSIAGFLSANRCNYQIYRYAHNNHTVAEFMDITVDKQLYFLEHNIMAKHLVSIDMLIDDPKIPVYPGIDATQLYDLK